MRTDQVNLTNLGGGINRGDSPTSIENNQCSNILNFDVSETHLTRRKGMERVLKVPFGATASRCVSAPVHGIHFFDSGVMLMGLYDRFARKNGNASIDISSGMETVMPSTFPWAIVDNKGVAWACRKAGRLWRVTEFLVSVAGLTPPSAAITLANAGAGNIGAGVYQYFVTFTTDLGDETDPSPIAEITLATASNVNLSNIPASAQARVTGKNLYRSLPNDAGTLWFLDSILASATAYSDIIPNGDLGDPFDPDNGAPPAEAYSCEKFEERLWVHNRVELFGSKVGKFETFSERFDSFDARGDREIRALHAWDTRLMVGTTGKKIYQLVSSGFDESGVRYDVSTFTSDHGCVSHPSMKSAEGLLFWLDSDGVFASPGGVPECISTPRIEDIIRGVDPASLEYACGWTNPRRTEYKISIGTLYDDEHIELIYNWRNGGSWTTRKYRDDSSAGTIPGLAAPNARFWRNDVEYAAFGLYNVYEIETGNVDRGVAAYPIGAKARFKGIQTPGMRSVVRKTHLDVTSVSEVITINLYQDGRPEVARTNTVALDETPDRNMKRIGLGAKGATYRPMCNSFELEVEYDGIDEIDINEVHFERDLYDVQGRSQ